MGSRFPTYTPVTSCRLAGFWNYFLSFWNRQLSSRKRQHLIGIETMHTIARVANVGSRQEQLVLIGSLIIFDVPNPSTIALELYSSIVAAPAFRHGPRPTGSPATSETKMVATQIEIGNFYLAAFCNLHPLPAYTSLSLTIINLL
jgi:hypothetical protein